MISTFYYTSVSLRDKIRKKGDEKMKWEKDGEHMQRKRRKERKEKRG